MKMIGPPLGVASFAIAVRLRLKALYINRVGHRPTDWDVYSLPKP